MNNTENEVGLIGSVLRDPSRFEGLYEMVKPEDIHWQCYQWAWKAMQSLFERGMKIDTITVGDELDRAGQLETFASHEGGIVGRPVLSRIRENGDPRNAESYAMNVADYSAKAKIEEMGKRWVYWAANGRRAKDIHDDIQKELSEIKLFDNRTSEHTQTLKEAISQAYDDTEKASKQKEPPMGTGYRDLDVMLGGLSAPDFYIIAGRPGQGKTAFLTSVMHNNIRKRILCFTLEMANRQIAKRLLAMESQVPYDKQKSGKLTETEWPEYMNAVTLLEDAPIILNDLPAISVSRMRQEIRRAILKLGGLDLIMLDYIQLAGVDGKYNNRVLEVGEISRGLKLLAKEFNLPILAAAQLSRAVEQRADKKPVLSDLRESGSLEQDSDVVMFIYRDEIKLNLSDIIVAKHRNGPVGSCTLTYRPELTRFENAYLR